ncbi:transcription termination/antitermination protein NusG [Candidatus Mycoplasma haematohominis]|uniref:Transcription termination/antitermination protein NusG n=1 Tax=Candidatus Mycoplasma haematohominis TaxID=1494318 RepID=A0A478FS60_9MOLU|nr:transcription termination/antitermination protein NusG [Candidatus Mycoplasma haemohominis]GCE63206.1 hypothetical protein MHSWG343_01850 [Candidatus Mycoplasma haemohominis]
MEMENMDGVLDGDENKDSEPSFYWYTLRVLRNEEKCIDQIREHIALKRLQNKIVDVKLFKEYSIVETEEYPPNSDFLPKKGFKSTPTSIWVQLANGNYKRIRLVEKKPFSGMVFIKMEFDMELFKMVRSWDASFSFLGFPTPSAMSDFQMQKTHDSLNSEMPDLVEYAKDKGYRLAEGNKITFKEPEEIKKEEEVEDIKEPIDLEEVQTVRELSEKEQLEAKKAEIYSDLNIKQFSNNFSSEKPNIKTKSKKDNEMLKVNDFVFISHLGFKGVIQEIDYFADKVVVGVQMFGRRQPVECKISEISII